MEKVRVYTIGYRRNARRHYDCVKNDICGALQYINDTHLIDRYRVQIVTGDNKTLLFDSGAIYHDPSVFQRMCNEGYGRTYWKMLTRHTDVMREIVNMCRANYCKNTHYNTRGYLSTDQYY